MDLKTRKYTAIEKIMQLDELSMGKLEQMLNDLLQEDTTLEQYNQELDRADAAIDQGDYLGHEEAVKKIKGWR